MKHILSLLLAVAFMLCACTSPEVPESEETQNPVESVESSDLPEDVEEDEEPVEDGEGEEPPEDEIPENVEPEEEKENIYNYKGIDFPGWYESDGFWINIKLLEETEIGQRLIQDSQNATTAYLAGDIEKLMEYFDNDEYADEQIKLIREEKEAGYLNVEIDETNTFHFNHMVFYGDNFDLIAMTYLIFSENYDGYIYVLIDMYLNESNEWKFKHIRTSP